MIRLIFPAFASSSKRVTDGRLKSVPVNLLLEWRKLWAEWCNHKLYFVSDERIDHRSYAARGIDKLPQKHLGAAACAIEKKGYRTDKGSYNRRVILENTNAEIEKLNFELSTLNTKKLSLKKEIIESELDCPLSKVFSIEVDKISNSCLLYTSPSPRDM